jgi:Domain of unknown function (DUF3841)
LALVEESYQMQLKNVVSFFRDEHTEKAKSAQGKRKKFGHSLNMNLQNLSIRLFSYQHPCVLEWMQNGGNVYANWDQVWPADWELAYRWMMGCMDERGIAIPETPPIWAWHSVGAWFQPPDEACLRNLCSDLQLEAGICLLELEVPAEQVLLSRYDTWNELLDYFYQGKTPKSKMTKRLFDIQPGIWPTDEYFVDIQATLPYLDTGWVKNIEVIDTQAILKGDF